MALSYGLFNSVSGDRVYSAEHFNKFMQGFGNACVFQNEDDGRWGFAYSYTQTTLKIKIHKGKGMVDGRWVEELEETELTLSSGDSYYDRYDVIGIRINETSRRAEYFIKKGTASSSPKFPTLEWSDNYKEAGLYACYIKSGESKIDKIISMKGYDYINEGGMTEVRSVKDITYEFVSSEQKYALFNGAKEVRILIGSDRYYKSEPTVIVTPLSPQTAATYNIVATKVESSYPNAGAIITLTSKVAVPGSTGFNFVIIGF